MDRTPERAVKDLVRQHWNGRAETFDDESHHGIHTETQRERWLSVLRSWTSAEPRRTLDVGCGTGVVSQLLAALGHRVTGIDVAPAMLARARRKAARAPELDVEFVRGDAETLPVPDGAVDTVSARHLVWTLPDPESALREWRRVLAPGGHLLLVEGYWDHEEPWDEYEAIHDDLPMYDGQRPEAMREALAAAGFENVAYEALDDPVLWGHEPRHDYYVMRGDVPDSA